MQCREDLKIRFLITTRRLDMRSHTSYTTLIVALINPFTSDRSANEVVCVLQSYIHGYVPHTEQRALSLIVECVVEARVANQRRGRWKRIFCFSNLKR
jgi:hypothetical protein